MPPSAPQPPSVVVVGAGVSGLVAARELSRWARVTVLDKARGVGGRLATRRAGPATFDHGAQFVTAHGEPFRSQVQLWAHGGVVVPWFGATAELDGGATADDDGGGHVRWRGRVGMSSIAKDLAAGLDVRCGRTVRSVRVEGDGWVVEHTGADATPVERSAADVLVLTAPVPQTLALLEAGAVELDPGDREVLVGVDYEPCLAVLAPLRRPWKLPPSGALRIVDGPVAWVADNGAKGVSEVPALTIHASHPASRAMWDDPDREVAAQLVAAAADRVGAAIDAVDGAGVQVQRWRFALPPVASERGAIVATGLPPLAVAGDAFAAARVEGAAASGRAAAAALALRVTGGQRRV